MSYPQGTSGRSYTQTDIPAASARRVTNGYHQQPTSWQQFERASKGPHQQSAPFAPPQGMHGFGGPSTPGPRDRSQGFKAPLSPMTPKTTLDYYKQKDLERSRYDDGAYRQGYPSAQQHQMQQQERLRQMQLRRQEEERQREERRLREEEELIHQEDGRLQREEWFHKNEREEEEKQRHMQELQQRQDEERAQRARQEQQRRYQEQLRLQQQQQQQQQQEQLRQQMAQQQQERQQQEHQEQEHMHQQQQEQQEQQEPGSKGARAIEKVLREVDDVRRKYELVAYQSSTGPQERNQARVTYIELLNRQIDMLDLVETEGKSEVKAARKAAVGTIQKLQGALDSFIERETSLLKLLE